MRTLFSASRYAANSFTKCFIEGDSSPLLMLRQTFSRCDFPPNSLPFRYFHFSLRQKNRPVFPPSRSRFASRLLFFSPSLIFHCSCHWSPLSMEPLYPSLAEPYLAASQVFFPLLISFGRTNGGPLPLLSFPPPPSPPVPDTTGIPNLWIFPFPLFPSQASIPPSGTPRSL